MNTLFDTVIAGKMKQYKPYQDLVKAVSQAQYPISLQGVQGSLLALIVHRLYQKDQRGMFFVFPTEKEAELFAQDCEAFDLPYMLFPWWGVAPYREIPGNAPVYGRRVQVLSELLNGFKGLIICSVRSLMGHLPEPKLLDDASFTLRRGNTINPSKTAENLVKNGFLRVNRVSVPGEFALRGEVLDLWLPGQAEAVRIVMDFDTVDDIRFFDPVSQNSGEHRASLVVHPFKEQIWTEEGFVRLRERLDSLPEMKQKSSEDKDWLVDHLCQGQGLEHIWYPLSLEHSASLLDYFPQELPRFFVEYERIYGAAEAFEREYQASWRKLRMDQALLPRSERLLWNLSKLQDGVKRLIIVPLFRLGEGSKILASSEDEDESSLIPESLAAFQKSQTESVVEEIEEDSKDERQHMPNYAPQVQIHFGGEQGRSWFGNINFLKDELESSVKAGYEIFLFAESELQAGRLAHLLKDFDIPVLAQKISTGFAVPGMKILLIEENEIFGRRKRINTSLKKVQSQVLDTFVDLEPGDYVVHVNHGIGRFCGIKRINAGGTERDYIELEYADEEFVFVPIEQVNLVQRYIGSQGGEPRLDKIGGKSWEKRKSAVKKNVEDIANGLIELYSKRKQARGHAFPKDSEWQIEFEASFPYEETEDQVKCISDVKEDMEKPVPMDRLVCGDVGYGKTEIALRAAFKAVSAGKQVAFLAPTTILVEQHFESLSERVKNFPVKIGMLSRFVSTKEQKTVLKGMAEGTYDIVIGTHRLLQKDVNFKDLGLMIVDEEQRFGVKDKERLKEMKHSIDCLTLTATPIPRTLHMSLLKIRDMSVLQTPPYNRRPIETFVRGFEPELVAEAIRREVARGGQVFYLHNRVESLENVLTFIQSLVPEVLVESAHGQMSAQELEDIMHRFIHGGFHVLVATTIIENGINIPNVNTIIIDRADMYGVSQLYQLRGRVGRSGRLAYAYLLYPGERALSELAMKRLQIISDYTELGSGFKIALKDLEVRGAGNLLGAEQSGEIVSVGFDLYLKLLDEAIRRRSTEEKDDDELEVLLDLEYSGFIPNTYVKEPSEKMEVYKKIAGINTELDLESVFSELSDRFGPLPDEVLSLMGLAEIRILCKKLQIISLRERKGVLEVEFGRVSKINVNRVMELIRTSGGSIRLDAKRPQFLLMNTEKIGLKEKSEFIRDRLSRLV